jgi:hypothetical protein
MAFTAKAPDGRPYTGSIVLPVAGVGGTAVPGIYNRVTITSDYAEIVYFLRNGNLYRRVFLVQSERQDSTTYGTTTAGVMLAGGGFQTGAYNATTNYVNPNSGFYNLNLSWLGLHDISARPSPVPSAAFPGSYAPILNTLGDLTNRENRAFNPRWANDYNGGGGAALPNPDGIPDDANGDGIPDFYPTLYPAVFQSNPALLYFPTAPVSASASNATFDTLPFPFVYPGSYSKAEPPYAANGFPTYGAVHSLDPTINPTVIPAGRPFFGSFLDPPYNHAPLDLGDALGAPTGNAQFQTWWGYPTKKETLSAFWTDPVKRVNDPASATYTTTTADAYGQQSPGLSRMTFTFLPPMTTDWRFRAQPYTENAGSATFALPPVNAANEQTWKALAEEDLILTNVRSFDVKAYDSVAGGYYDLGYMSGPTNYPTLQPGQSNPAMYNQTPLACFTPLGTIQPTLNTFGHEGRIPPLTTDLRFDAQFPAFHIGDDDPNGVGIVRLRRIFDTWSTAYTNVPSQTILNYNPSTATYISTPANGMPYSAQNGFRPPLPSYPPPYPAPLRGIQIQIRVTDPNNQQLKVLTIRQDFNDKL